MSPWFLISYGIKKVFHLLTYPNVLIGENDSGKAAIIDAVKMVLKTHSAGWIKIEGEDFFKDAQK